jgi:uridine phosphorylase
MRTLASTDHRVGVVGGFGIGAPAACSVLEALIIFGVKRFVSMGAAGSLQPDLYAGDLVICDKAIRDEGTSYHYLADSKYAYAGQSMLARLLETAQHQQLPCRLGSSWTTDAPYRETLPEIRHYQQEGVVTVEMEASALFAVAAYRGVELGAIFTISDLLTGPDWEPHFDSEAVAAGMRKLFEIAVESLR